MLTFNCINKYTIFAYCYSRLYYCIVYVSKRVLRPRFKKHLLAFRVAMLRHCVLVPLQNTNKCFSNHADDLRMLQTVVIIHHVHKSVIVSDVDDINEAKVGNDQKAVSVSADGNW